MNPPSPPPIHAQVKALEEEHERYISQIIRLRDENRQLHQERESNDIIIAKLNRRIQELEGA